MVVLLLLLLLLLGEMMFVGVRTVEVVWEVGRGRGRWCQRR